MHFGRIGVVLACLLLAGSMLPSPVASEAAGSLKDPPPPPLQGQIQASYDVGVANIDLGTVDVTATFGSKDYALTADGKFSLLAGLLYKATGKTTSKGTLSNFSPKPQRYTLSFSDSKKRQRVQIAFAGGTVRTVKITPKKRPDKQAIPIPDGQLSNVLDPLTAAFMSIRSQSAPSDLGVCNQTLRVFDGKQRFDLTLSPKRSESIVGRAPQGVSEQAAVCHVRYEPIGGYRPQSSAVQFVQKADGIEAWLVSVPGTDRYLPYKVVVPTAWGDGSITLTGLSSTSSPQSRARGPSPL